MYVLYPFSLSLAVVGACRRDVVFILDSSVTVGKLNWFVIKQFVTDIIRGLKIIDDQTRVGVVTFSSMAVTNFHLQQYDDVDEIAQKIWDMSYLSGGTNIADGISVIGYVALLRQFSDYKFIYGHLSIQKNIITTRIVATLIMEWLILRFGTSVLLSSFNHDTRRQEMKCIIRSLIYPYPQLLQMEVGSKCNPTPNSTPIITNIFVDIGEQ